jgi:CBS domain-containing protein
VNGDEIDLPAFSGGDASIGAYIVDDVQAITASASVREAASRLAEAGVGLLVVGTKDAVEGVVSERDIVTAVAQGLDLDATKLADIESTTLEWTTPDATVGEVVEEMMETYVRHVLVGENRRLVGIVSMRDVMAAYLD